MPSFISIIKLVFFFGYKVLGIALVNMIWFTLVLEFGGVRFVEIWF
jgi:hypothetical protein